MEANNMESKRSYPIDTKQTESGDAPDVKKTKKCDQDDTGAKHLPWENLGGFLVVKVLSCDAQNKTLVIHARASLNNSIIKNKDNNGTIEESQNPECLDGDDNGMHDAIVVLEKTPFDPEKASTLLSENTLISKVFNNDIYGTYEGFPDAHSNALRTTIIFPATQKHMEKYKSHDSWLIRETETDYADLTLPWIESESFQMQWIYNILSKKKESEFIIYEDVDPVSGFIILPDLKWDKKQMDNMYVSGIVHRRDIKSIRDLTTEHLPLLHKLLHDGLAAIEKTYGIDKKKVRAYFHYQPSYYHLHVHYNQIKYNAPGSNVLKAHLLTDVIDNITMWPDYYQKKTLTFICKEHTKLYAQYKEAGRL